MIMGLIIGFIVGFIIAFILLRAMVYESDSKYKKSTQRWEAGTEEYKKAVQVLEVQRTERTDNRALIGQALGSIIAFMEKHDPTSEEISEFKELKAQLGA